MNKVQLTDLGNKLEQSIASIELYDQYLATSRHEPTVHVPNAGNVLLFAYEQLRNASENIEDNLLFQRAILRFYKRNLSFAFNRSPVKFGHELIIELTQAEYLKNNSVPISSIDKLDALINDLYAAYWELTKDKAVSRATAERWVLEIMSVKSEQLFNNPVRILSFAHFAHYYFLDLINIRQNIVEGETVKKADRQMLLYVCIHKALLKSDDANIRNALLDLYSISTIDLVKFVEFNKKYDKFSVLKTTANVSRLVDRNGAPMRVLRSTFFNKYDDIDTVDISKVSKTLNKIEAQVSQDYNQVKRSVGTGIIKSIIFLLITKAIIGVVVEIPYDLVITGSIVVAPLLINLIFPPLFIAITALTFKHPTDANKIALVDYEKSMLYDPNFKQPAFKLPVVAGSAYLFNAIYIVMFAVVFYLATVTLMALQFNIVQGVIFFIFLSTASFLGYRLTLQIKELEIVTTNQGFLALLRDFLYAPFIFAGRRISYRFAKMNIIAQILDIVIELPLKTTLRLVRQWTVFLNNKKDELL